ncbi:MAG TPA: histidine phosphatase family protein [Candidatus Saccharimonadales bacterium]|nr:histidine phosphatase family protein [Candidatus Saccharimonadales bacterium]
MIPALPRPERAGLRRLILLRHGETTAGTGRLLGSSCDLGLSERGRSQAAASGRRLLGRTVVGWVISSPQRRALETAALAFPGLPVIIDERLREQDFGELTGLTWLEAKARFGQRARAWRTSGAPPPGGESPATLRARVADAASSAMLLPLGDPRSEVILVTHHTPIRSLIATSRGWPISEWRRVHVPYGGVLTVGCGAPGSTRR